MSPLLAIELSGTGTHPASWRRTDSRAEELFTGAYWADAVRGAEDAGLDVVFIHDSFELQPGGPDVTRGRIDAVAIAARVAASTSRIGLLPHGAVTHTEPFHLAKAAQSLDFVTHGRAGWEVTVSETPEQALAFGRKPVQTPGSLWHEAQEAIEVATRLWDSWEDDAEIRDHASGRFIDREKLHYIDFHGDNFAVKGPSITPRSPQGQVIIAVRAADEDSAAVAVERADLIRVSAPDLARARTSRTRLRDALTAAGRDPDTVAVLLDIDVLLAATTATAEDALRELDTWVEPPAHTPRLRHIGTADTLRTLLDTVREIGAADGVTLRPLALSSTIEQLTALARKPPETSSLRARLGLSRPASRYATSTEGVPS